MIPAEQKLVLVCDQLLAATGRLRFACEKAGDPWPPGEAVKIINQILDIRNQVSPPKPQTPKAKLS